MLNIITGRVQRPQKVVLYGVEGIGKTSLAAQTPDPLFIDTEGGTAHLDVRRLQKPETWEELIALIKEVAATPDVCRTLVLDTADWAEAMAIDHICQKFRQPGLESFGYGKGYTFLSEEFSRLLAACDEVIASGKHVVITAHAKQRRVELPDETGGFDVWGLKLSKQCAPLLKECGALLFLQPYQNKTIVVATDSSTHKAQGEQSASSTPITGRCSTRRTATTCRTSWSCARQHRADLRRRRACLAGQGFCPGAAEGGDSAQEACSDTAAVTPCHPRHPADHHRVDGQGGHRCR